MPHLLVWLDRSDECLRDHAAVDLLEVLQGALVVFGDIFCISNGKRHCLISGRGTVIAIRDREIRVIDNERSTLG